MKIIIRKKNIEILTCKNRTKSSPLTPGLQGTNKNLVQKRIYPSCGQDIANTTYLLGLSAAIPARGANQPLSIRCSAQPPNNLSGAGLETVATASACQLKLPVTVFIRTF